MRALGWLLPKAIVAALWSGGILATLVGSVMVLDWRELTANGVEAVGEVEECTYRASGVKSRGPGYYSCHYTYRDSPEGPVHRGYFQASGARRAGEAIAIRFRADRPDASATEEDLRRHPHVPGAILVLGVGFLAWLGWGAWRRNEPRRRQGARP